MDSAIEGSGSTDVSPDMEGHQQPSSSNKNDFNVKDLKRTRENRGVPKACWCHGFEWKKRKICPKVINNPAPFAADDVLQGHNSNAFGSVSNSIESLIARRKAIFGPFQETRPVVACQLRNAEKVQLKEDLNAKHHAPPEIIDLVDDDELHDTLPAAQVVPAVKLPPSSSFFVIIDSDDEDSENEKHLFPLKKVDYVNPSKSADNFLAEDFMEPTCADDEQLRTENICHAVETDIHTDKSPVPILEADSMEGNEQADANLECVGKISEVDQDEGMYVAETEMDKSPDPILEVDNSMEEDSGHVYADSAGVEKICEIDQEEGMDAGETEIDKSPDPILEVENCMVEGSEQVDADFGGEEKISETDEDESVDVCVEDDEEIMGSNEQLSGVDTLADVWSEMAFALECSKDAAVDSSTEENDVATPEECDHSFILKDDIGDVCRICGFVRRRIETIIDFQYTKGKSSSRTYRYESSQAKDQNQSEIFPEGAKRTQHDYCMTEIVAHPRHSKVMKPHQVEGFKFLLSNLVTDNPGGCIMAHAPGSGKTFMIISFLQSFMAKYPHARPLIVLPRGILSTWKKEFQTWQVEDIPLYDLYSSNAETRSQQLQVLKEWAAKRSILFLGYKQFSNIVCDVDTSQTARSCQDILLTCPSILIMDEGHTPRNKSTDILNSLEKVQTTRKVVLSGTLYQNHVEEVFNVLNLVRPKFLKMETSKTIKNRILSRVQLSGRKSSIKDFSNDDFYDAVERTLLNDENFNRKVTLIRDLREMTSNVLHYYKGDSLDELPGLVDFTVFLELSPRQKREVAELKKLKYRFKVNSEGSNIYVHPQLKAGSTEFVVKGRADEQKIDLILDGLDEEGGVKAKFYLNLLQLCESTGEKLLVFSQYLLPLKFLERLTVKLKGYSVGKEIFVITGDSDSDIRDSYMEQFNTSSHARVFFGSIKACGEGISLVGASRIIVLDIHLNPSVTRQAIGRAFRPGQVRKVYTYRLVAYDSPEEEDHLICFRKESISKMWFEWNGCQGEREFDMESIDAKACGDLFLESSKLNGDVVSVCKR